MPRHEGKVIVSLMLLLMVLFVVLARCNYGT